MSLWKPCNFYLKHFFVQQIFYLMSSCYQTHPVFNPSWVFFVTRDSSKVKVIEDRWFAEIEIMTVMVESVKAEEGERPKIETFDDILPYIGEAGRYQWFLFIVLLPFTFVYAFLYFTQFFITLLPAEHWCTVPELNDRNFTDEQKWARVFLQNIEVIVKRTTMFGHAWKTQ